MNKRRYVLTLITLVFLPALLFHFQNCAPASSTVGGVVTDGPPGTVGIVDNLNKSQIQFVTSDSQIQDDALTVDLSGLCARAHDGAKLKFTVWDENQSQTALTTGISECDKGQFKIGLLDLEQYICGVGHMLVVESDWGASTYAHFSRRCQPPISVQEPAASNMPYGTTCTLEYSPATAAENPCLRLCYRDNQVVYSQPLDVSACSSLATSLAGQ